MWEEYLKNPRDLFDKELEQNKKSKKPERYRFELHGYTLLEANKKIKDLINSCQQKGFQEILLITDPGKEEETIRKIKKVIFWGGWRGGGGGC